MTTICLRRNEYLDSSNVELPSAGVGDESKEVTRALLIKRSDFYERSTTKGDWQELENRLQREVSLPELLVNAEKLIAKLPKWLEAPSLEVYEDDDEVVLEWYEDSDHLVNVVIRTDGTLYYSGLLGPNARRAERDEINNGVPAGLVSAIGRIYENR